MSTSNEMDREPQDNGHTSSGEGTGRNTETEPGVGPTRNVSEAPSSSLLREDDAEGFRSRWSDIQAGFVDEPRKSVEAADSLVVEVMERVADGFAHERSGLEQHWERGEDVSTEDLRVALQRYRSFFERLLAA